MATIEHSRVKVVSWTIYPSSNNVTQMVVLMLSFKIAQVVQLHWIKWENPFNDISITFGQGLK